MARKGGSYGFEKRQKELKKQKKKREKLERKNRKESDLGEATADPNLAQPAEGAEPNPVANDTVSDPVPSPDAP